MHGATASKTELAPEVATWVGDVRKITSTASGSRSKKGALQDEEDSGVSPKEIELRYGKLMRRLARHPEINAANISCLKDKLELVRADLKAQSKLSSLPARLDEIDRQIDTAKSQKPLDNAGKEARLKWQRDVVAKLTNEFAGKCNAATLEITNLGKARAKELAKKADADKKKQLEEAAKATDLDLIKNPIESLRVLFSKDLMLEGPGKEQGLAVKYDAQLGSLKKDLTAFVNGVDFLGAVRGEVKAKAEAAETSKLQAESQKGAQELEAARKEALASLAKLNDLGSIMVPGYTRDIQQAKSVKEIQDVHSEIRNDISSEQENSKERTSKHGKEADAIGKQLDKVMSGQSDAAKAALKGLQAELEQTKAMAATGHPGAAMAAARLAKKIEKAAADAANKDSAFSKLFSRAAELQKMLGDDTVTKFFAKEKAPLQKALDGLTKDADALDPSESLETLTGIDVQIVALKNRANALHDWQDLMKKQVALLAADVKNLMGDKLGVAALVRSDTKMALLLKDIEAAYQTPGVDQKAVNLMIDDVNRRIFNLRALDKGGKKDEFKKGIEEEQKQAEADVNKKKQEEKAKADKLKEFQGKCSALKKRIDAVEKKVADAKGSKEDVDAARSIASTAESISKNGELKDAEEKLAVADNKVTQLENNPGGFAMESAKELGKAPERWTAAIEEAKAAIDEVAGEAEKLALQAGKDKNVVAEKVKSVKTLFKTPAMLGAPLKTLRDEQAKPEAQKAAREQILREIRELRTMMDTNPVLQLVRRSPFKTKIPVTLGIKKFLDSLELNTLRAVRPQK